MTTRHLILSIVVAVLLVFISLNVSNARTWHVNPSGTGEAATIQAGIDSAAAGDSVSLADGTYTGDGNRDIDFSGKAITVYSQSGDPNACVIDCEGSVAAEHFGFIFENDETAASILEGVTIRGGYFLSGGIVVGDASPSVNNCVFVENTATMGGGAVGCGFGSPVFSYCIFERNTAQVGGAVYFNNASPSFLYCEFREDSASVSGGAFASEHGSPTLQDCTFENNWAGESGGAIRCFYDDAVAFTDLTVADNNAGQVGGGMSLEDNVIVNLTGCLITGNTAQSGGGLHVAGPAAIDNCTLADNTATTAGGGGLSYTGDGPLDVTNCTFSENAAVAGAGIAYGANQPVTIANTIIANSTAGEAVFCYAGAVAMFSCCDFSFNMGGNWVGCAAGNDGIMGNFSMNPAFCGLPGSGNYYLQSDSPCAPGNHPYGIDCGVIGALPVGCGDSPAKKASWGKLKSLYND